VLDIRVKAGAGCSSTTGIVGFFLSLRVRPDGPLAASISGTPTTLWRLVNRFSGLSAALNGFGGGISCCGTMENHISAESSPHSIGFSGGVGDGVRRSGPGEKVDED